MTEQIYGIFDSIENTEKAISALKDHSVEDVEISVLRRSDGKGLPIVETDAHHGITPTSAADVEAGAIKGGAVGLGLGIVGGVIALMIPGVGPILAAGPLWAAFGAAAVATAAGVAGGSVVGYLVDQGVPEMAATRYHDAINAGNILVSVRSAHISNADARMLLEKYGANEIDEHPINTPGTPASLATGEPKILDLEEDFEAKMGASPSTPSATLI